MATSQALWLHPDLYGAAEAVVEAAPVAVPDEGGDDEQEQDGPYEDAPEAEAAAVLGDHTEPQETLAGVQPMVPTVRALIRRKTPSAQFPAACWSPRASSPYAITMQIDQSMKMAPKRRPSGAIAPGPSSGSPSLLPR